MNCAGCKLPIARGELLRCSTCKKLHHYRCINMTSSYYVENKHKLINSWCCPSCKTTKKQIRNDDTPVRRQSPPKLDDTTMSIDDQIQDDQSILGDTGKYDTPPTNIDTASTMSPTNPIILQTDPITLEKISQLLDRKLEVQQRSILSKIKSTIQSEINIAVLKLQQEISQKTEQLSLEQTRINTNVIHINETIEKLEIENEKLKTEMVELKNKNMHLIMSDNSTNDTSKIFVIHGLNEYYKESEKDLEDRVIFALQDTLNVDLTGYIEDLNRIGRNGQRRPLRVELISKKMTKYILENAGYLKSLGLCVSGFLDKESLQRRRQQRERQSITQRNERITSTQNYDNPNLTRHTLVSPTINQTRPDPFRL